MSSNSQSLTIGALASLLTVLGAVLLVIYAEGIYGVWDLMVGLVVFGVCWQARSDLESWLERGIGALGLGVSTVVIAFAGLTFFGWLEDFRTLSWRNGFLDIEGALSIGVGVSFFIWLSIHSESSR